MSKTTKIALLVAAVMVILGIAMVTGSLTALGGNYDAFATARYETQTYPLDRDFDRISIDTQTADIRICLAQDGQGMLEISQQEKLNHRVSVENGLLSVTLEDTRDWYDHISLFSVGESGMTLYLPEEDYEALMVKVSTGHVTLSEEMFIGDVRITATTGDIRLEKLTAEAVNVKTSTGRIALTSVTCVGDVDLAVTTGTTRLQGVWCEDLVTTGDTGDITVTDGTANTLSIIRGTGDVRFENADAGQILVETDTGDVTGTLRSEKVFVTETDTGDVRVPATTSGGLCQITTDTGDISIKIS